MEAALAPVLKQLGPTPEPEQILYLKICDPAMGSGAFLVEACRQLGEHLLEAWRRTDAVPPIPPDEDELLHARRVIAQRCLYGVDKNDMAVDLAKLSLWLATLAREHPFTFLDHALRQGDSLVGFTTRQISYFDWSDNPQQDFFGKHFQEKLELVLRNRAVILEAADTTPYETQQQRLAKADEYLVDSRRAGDMLAAGFFMVSKPKAREKERLAKGKLFKRALESFSDLEADDEVKACIRALRAKGVTPFHWEIEFPEVFRRGGFDVIVGNPPFAGKNTITGGNAPGYLDWLKLVHPESHGNSDLSAHFFRRAFTLLKPRACFGLIATNTIGQGDTRSTGLRWICANGGVIYRARKRYKWPLQAAAVVVSVVHVHKGAIEAPYELDGRAVDRITAYLFHAGGSEDPEILVANEDKSFQGSIVLGMGFTFDDTDKKGVASPVSEMHRLIAKDPRNGERIFPYIGGEEINDSPTHAYHRYVINFEDFPLKRKETGHSWFGLTEKTQKEQLREGIVAPDYPSPVAADWPDLLAIVEERVRPERNKLKDSTPDGRRRKQKYWLWGRYTPALFDALKQQPSTLAVSRVGQIMAFARVSTSLVGADSVVFFPIPGQAAFCVLQSRVHEAWARFMASSMKDDLRYTPSDCFETFPFPVGFESIESLEAAGRVYYDFRADVMMASTKQEGLTKIYNRFHDPGDTSTEIVELRRLHTIMDRAVLDTYGWSTVLPKCDFFTEFDEEEAEESSGKKKRFRYRWPDDVRDDVLARLLVLNRQRYEEEVLAGLHDRADGSKRTRRKADADEEELDEDQGELDL